MNGLLQELLGLAEVEHIRRELESGCPSAVMTGLSPVHRVLLSAALSRAVKRPLVLVCADERECRRFAGDLEGLLGEPALWLPGREMHLRPETVGSRQWDYRRMAALYRMLTEAPPVILTTAEALCQRCIPPQVLSSAVRVLEPGQRYDPAQLCRDLADAGYTRCDQVEGPGQFALRGGILDVFSPEGEQPVRCDFFDDEIDALGRFDPGTQRRTENIPRAVLLPAAEVLPGCRPEAAEILEKAARRYEKKDETARLCATLRADAAALRAGVIPGGGDRYMAAVYEEFSCPADYLPKGALVCISESGRVAEGLKQWLWQRHQDIVASEESGVLAGEFSRLQWDREELVHFLGGFPVCQMESLPTSRFLLEPKAMVQVAAKQLSVYGGSLETAVTDLTHYLTSGYRVLVLCGGRVRAENLQRLLRERKIPAALDFSGHAMPKKGQALIALGTLSAGSEYPGLQLAVLTEGQLTARVSGKEPRRKAAPKNDPTRQRLQSYADLTPGDLVVHQHHGIGRFVSMMRLPVDGVEKDYIKIAYAGSDCLYVPATQLDLVSKYIGTGEDTGHTKLNKLGGTEWAKTTHRAKAAAKDLAKGLIDLYARRQRLEGFAFSPDSPWQQEFEEAFPYTETDDQLRCIREIKSDMEQPRPMDRLLCGDVGYGKTEVALRAVMKCILDGKQAAILVPTTVLAQQHYATAVSRFRSFPVTVEVLSRFRSPKQVKEILERTAQGKVDLLIGTHKLLQKNVASRLCGFRLRSGSALYAVFYAHQLDDRSRN